MPSETMPPSARKSTSRRRSGASREAPAVDDRANVPRMHAAPSVASTSASTTGRVNAFGARVKARREDLGLTQDQVAAAVSDARSCIANMERGVRPPYDNHDRLRALAAVLQEDPSEFIQLAEENRQSYTLPGAGPGVTNAHRDLAAILEAGWGHFPDATLDKARLVVEQAEPVAPGQESTPSPFGAWLLATRQAKDVAQSALAKAMGIARSYVSMVENGAKGASFPDEAVVAVAKLLGASADEVRSLVARSRQFYKVETRLGQPDEVTLAHRRLAVVLVARWHTLPAKALEKARKILMAAAHS